MIEQSSYTSQELVKGSRDMILRLKSVELGISNSKRQTLEQLEGLLIHQSHFSEALYMFLKIRLMVDGLEQDQMAMAKHHNAGRRIIGCFGKYSEFIKLWFLHRGVYLIRGSLPWSYRQCIQFPGIVSVTRYGVLVYFRHIYVTMRVYKYLTLKARRLKLTRY